MTVARHAYVDESSRRGVYLLTAVAVPSAEREAIARLVRDSVPRGRRRAHLSSEGAAARRQILRSYVDLAIDAQVVITDHDRGDDHPARDRCLRALLGEVGSLNVQVMVLDTRQEHRDAQDRRTIVHAIGAGNAPPGLHYQHQGSRNEPLLWLPDAFGWAYGAGGVWRKMIASKVTVISA